MKLSRKARWGIGEMTRQDLTFVYLTRLEKAKFDLAVAERSRFLPADPIDKLRWDLEVAVRQSLVHVYDGLIKILQEPVPKTNSQPGSSASLPSEEHQRGEESRESVRNGPE
jgi:hypothetical protein